MIKHIKKKFFVLCMTTLLGVELLGTPVSIKAAENVDLTETSETVQSGEQIALTATNFPDANFRASIKAQYDKDGDGYINAAEVTKLICYYRGVKSLKGIE